MPLLTLNLQFFAENGEAQGSSVEGENNQIDIQTQGTEEPSVEGGESQNQGGIVQSQTDVNIDQVKSQAQIEMLKNLGFDDVDSLKDALTKFKEYEDKNKTESQKLAEKVQSLQKQLTTTQSEKEILNAKVIALSKNVKSDAIDDVIALAKAQGQDDIGKAIDSVIEKYPHFTNGGDQSIDDQQQKPKFTNGEHKKDGTKDAFLSVLLGK